MVLSPHALHPQLEPMEFIMRKATRTTSTLIAAGTLAELAEQQGVEVADLIDALVADAEEHIAEHVAEGDLTHDEADEDAAAVE